MKNVMQNLIYRIAKFASTIPTTGARYANSMGHRLTFGAERDFACAISVFNATMARPKVIAVCTSNTYLLYIHSK